MTMYVNKLVRDEVPKIIRKKGSTPITHIATEDEYWKKLKEKLVEEADEFIKTDSEEEIADLMEVIYAICSFKGIDMKKLKALKKAKANKNGKFKERIILDEIR